MQILKSQTLFSKNLNREVIFDLVTPPNHNSNIEYLILLMNDGQDFEKLGMDKTLKNSWLTATQSFVFVGVHANKNRLSEYGTSGVLDFNGRGKNSLNYQKFIIKELLPYLAKSFFLKNEGHVVCGFSLGGLSALDMTLENPNVFNKVGVFSGALWWRSKAYGPYYNDATDRIIHQKFKKSVLKASLQFWFECGTQDEKADRNNNGVIDSIDDTNDLIKILKEKGYDSVQYLEILAGEHNQNTWKNAFPDFLRWAFA
jgi:predicted alpha/beta superfamily hydrolase